ncbi:MAG TPA: preprotein translocase subunit SecG [Eubacteriales bacterium]|nr:preprotein translocase subunit SecG [Clostridia bacterium]HRV73057.1 preprotein translocase subunit SecG [Eubacteriales bacterium]
MELASEIIQYVLVAISVILIALVLIQKTKSAGLGAAYGSDTESFTTRGKAAKREAKLQKYTLIASIIFGVLALALVIL